MIEKRCKTLATQFSDARQAYELDQRLARIQRAVADVRALRQQATQASEILTALSSRVTDPEARTGIEDAIHKAKSYRGVEDLWKHLRSDENLLGRTNHEAYNRTLRATRSATEELRRVAERTWHGHARSSISDDGPILEVFRGSNAKAVASLERLHDELFELSRTAFPSKDKIKEFDQKVKAYGCAFQSLGGDIPKAVRHALHAAASPSGAPIDLFSSDVVAWLRERNVVAAFRVKARSTP